MNELRKTIEDTVEALEWIYGGAPVRKDPVTALKKLKRILNTGPGDPTAWVSNSITRGNGKQLHWTYPEAYRWSSDVTPLWAWDDIKGLWFSPENVYTNRTKILEEIK